MSELESYALELRKLPIGVQQFRYVVGDEFFREKGSSDIRSGNVDVELTVDNRKDYFDLSFRLNGEITVGCDRCLDDMELPVDAGYHLTVRFGDAYDDSNDELIVLPEDERSFDVSGLIYDTVELAIPLKHVHADGECNSEMEEQLHLHSGRKAEGTEDPRWASLKGILDNKQ